MESCRKGVGGSQKNSGATYISDVVLILLIRKIKKVHRKMSNLSTWQFFLICGRYQVWLSDAPRSNLDECQTQCRSILAKSGSPPYAAVGEGTWLIGWTKDQRVVSPKLCLIKAPRMSKNLSGYIQMFVMVLHLRTALKISKLLLTSSFWSPPWCMTDSTHDNHHLHFQQVHWGRGKKGKGGKGQKSFDCWSDRPFRRAHWARRKRQERKKAREKKTFDCWSDRPFLLAHWAKGRAKQRRWQ